MVKKRVEGNVLSWLVVEALQDVGSNSRISVAVVPEERTNWRIVIAGHSRRFLTKDLKKRLAKIERDLQSEYELSV